MDGLIHRLDMTLSSRWLYVDDIIKSL